MSLKLLRVQICLDASQKVSIDFEFIFVRRVKLYGKFKIFYGCVDRGLQNAAKQPIYFYQLDVKWKMFHEDPYRGDSKNDQISRLEFCRSDHGDDLMVVFGEEFIKGW